jgi:hypothetical protein
VQSVGGICDGIQDSDEVERTTTSSCDKVETTLNVVRSEKMTRRKRISVAEQALGMCRIQDGHRATVPKPQKSALTLTKVNGTKGTLSTQKSSDWNRSVHLPQVPTFGIGRIGLIQKKSKGKPLNATSTNGQTKSHYVLFGHGRALATTADDGFESIVDSDSFDTTKGRRTPPAEIPRMKLRSRKASPLSHGADNPIEIDDSDEERVPCVRTLKVREPYGVDT